MINILSKEEISHINDVCEKYKIVNYSINPDGSIDVVGDVDFFFKKLDKLPIKFGIVGGFFECSNNKLTSLEECPSAVGDGFYCGFNQLTSLEGCPTSVGGHFSCNDNDLTSLEFSPTSVGGHFNCKDNQLTSLKGFTESLSGDFFYYGNDLPDHFTNLLKLLSHEERQIFIKYQHDLRIWDNNEYNEEEAQILYEEIKDGML